MNEKTFRADVRDMITSSLATEYLQEAIANIEESFVTYAKENKWVESQETRG